MEVKWSSEAREDLVIIEEYHFRYSRRAAAKIVDGFLKEIVRLTNNPFRCPLEPMLPGYRYSVVRKWKIIYRAEKDAIYIVAIFDCRQDPEKITERTEEK